MKETFTKSMAWLHTWAGLVMGWMLFAIFVTGTLAVFDMEISHWARPELHRVGSSDASALAHAETALRDMRPDAERWFIYLSNEREPAARLYWRDGRASGERYMDPADGALLPEARATQGGKHFEDFHAQLHADDLGTWIVSAVTVVLLVILVSGIVIHKRIFRDFFTFRPRAGRQRSWLDGHNVAAVLTLPFQIMIAYSGLVAEHDEIMPAGIQVLYDGERSSFSQDLHRFTQPRPSGMAAALVPLAPVADEARRLWGGDPPAFVSVLNPGDAGARIELFRVHDDRLIVAQDRVTFDGVTGKIVSTFAVERPTLAVQSVIEGLHYAEFGGPIVRWLYFLSGAAGSAMIATGLVLFTVKRRERHAGESDSLRRFYALAEKINIAAVAGVLIACVAYFWANRLLPVEVPNRASWEIVAFFSVWLASIPHALLRPARCAWVEQLGCAAALCLLLPLLNILTTDTHLLWAVPRGQWAIAGIDLTALGFGVLLAAAVWKILRRHRAVEFS